MATSGTWARTPRPSSTTRTASGSAPAPREPGGRAGTTPFPATRCRRSLELGFKYYQEFAPEDEALDKGETFAILDELRVGSTTYRDVLQVLETTDVEPDSREFKYYAPAVGLIRVEEGLDANLANPELTFNRVEAAPIPLPPGLFLIGTGLVGLLALGRRQRTTTLAPMATRS